MEYDRESGMQFPEFGHRGGGIQNARLFWIPLLYMGGVERLSTNTSYRGPPYNTDSPPTERTLGPAAVCLVSLGNLSNRRSWFTNGMAGRAELDRGRGLRAKCKSLSKPTWNHHECRHNNSVENAFQRFYYDLKVLTKQKNIQGLKTVILDIKC